MPMAAAASLTVSLGAFMRRAQSGIYPLNAGYLEPFKIDASQRVKDVTGILGSRNVGEPCYTIDDEAEQIYVIHPSSS
jgi:hypothetical protein